MLRSDPGNKLKQAAQAHPNQPITIEGPVSGTVVHAQYNTPVGLYSGNQIVNTLVETAAARGANVPDPATFGWVLNRLKFVNVDINGLNRITRNKSTLLLSGCQLNF